MELLVVLFLVTAILYSSVGFGGGSTYLALLLIWGIPYFVLPVIALSCNIIVVAGNCFNYIRAGNLNFKLLLPYLIGSIPLAYVGGSLAVEKQLFEILLFLVLLAAGFLLLFNFKSYDDKDESYKKIPIFISLYWVLLASVELRYAPFALWIEDLSMPDPYYVLPVIMGISMYIQTKLNPAATDPIQQKVMQLMPLVFSIFFFFFPAGLVLYSLVNNSLSILQQWQITRMYAPSTVPAVKKK